MRPEHFINANGFSNNFFGWGAEDDDFTLRMFSRGLCIVRDYQSLNLKGVRLSDSTNLAPFTMFNHKPSRVNTDRFKVLTNSFWNSKNDGLKNIKELTVDKIKELTVEKIKELTVEKIKELTVEQIKELVVKKIKE